MNLITEAMTQMISFSEKPLDTSKIRVPKNLKESLEWECENFNHTKGILSENDGYNCPECMNRGYFEEIKDDYIVSVECRCMKIRKNLIRFRNSGLANHAKHCTFENFQTPYDWQRTAKEKAMRYAVDNSEKWLFFCGQSGCGKTHLCTAVCMELIKREYDVQYVMWRDLVHYLEANRFDDDGKYSLKIRELQNIAVLYIDDFLKTTRKDKNGKIQPSETELNAAYEIINSRVISGGRTLISSELSIKDISTFDEATGGRISDSSRGSQILISYDKTRNFRFYGKEGVL